MEKCPVPSAQFSMGAPLPLGVGDGSTDERIRRIEIRRVRTLRPPPLEGAGHPANG